MLQLDVRHLLCPLPVIRAQAFVASLNTGDTVTIRSTDPGTLQDIPAWCRLEGHQVIDSRRASNGDIVITIRVQR